MRKGICETVNGPGPELFAFIILLFLLMSGSAFAQDGSGRSETTARKPAVSSAKTRNRKPKSERPFAPPAPAARIETGRLAVMVNEGGSEVLLSRTGGAAGSELISVTSKARSLILRTLPTGSYDLLVKKPGFFEDKRTFDIVDGKRQRAEINLRPMMARLTIIANVPDAVIDIEKVGIFNRPVRKLFIKPETYRIIVRKRGYESYKTSVDLRIPGQEKVINVVLQPLRIDAILAQAGNSIKSGGYETAADLTNDVLLLNPAHAKANMLYGLIKFHRGDLSASSYLIKAVKNGETVTFPIKILEENGRKKMVEAELLLNRDSIALRSGARFDLNYNIAARDISEFRLAARPMFDTSIVLDASSIFHGRPIAPRLKIYSHNAFLQPDSQAVSCIAAAGSSCATDADIIFKLLSDWRSLTASFAGPR